MTGRFHSFQSLGTLDGPGVRFVAFAQGCPLRCGCCHNPDTWDPAGGREWTAEAILQLWNWDSREDLLKARGAIDYLLKKLEET